MSVKQVTINFIPAQGGNAGHLRIAEFREDNVVDVWEGFTEAESVIKLIGLPSFTNLALAGQIDLRGRHKTQPRSPSPDSAA